MTDLDSGTVDLPEFHVVVRRPGGRGPLGPYRLALAVGFALMIAGQQLFAAATTGIGIDTALLLAAGSATFIWVLSGVVSRIIASGRRTPPPARTG